MGKSKTNISSFFFPFYQLPVCRTQKNELVEIQALFFRLNKLEDKTKFYIMIVCFHYFVTDLTKKNSGLYPTLVPLL